MKCWNSAFNAQGPRLIIQVAEVKIYVADVEALRKKERQDETHFSTKIDGFLSFIPCWMLMYFLADFFESHPVYDQIQGSSAVFFLLYGYNSNRFNQISI
jgi:hypothetical protein